MLERRKDWNTRTPEEYALPTEIWCETIGRWKRYFEVRDKITSGEITEINDFITYNLNIRQFIQDVLEGTEDPDLIRHFYKAIHSVTILDPTCGSGAFLFAALNILEPLYEACIERMEQFTAEEPRRYKFFHEVLAEVNSEEHPNLRYYIYKTIILNNLYGVDIMRETVEIAKLRLFLKMVGAVDMNLRKPNFGLEPLPDIDFNIRAGNTLVGFATEKELMNAIQYDELGNMRLDFGGKLGKFKEECQIVATAFRRFQDAQLITDKGEETHKKAKAELQNRLDALNEKLNGYLASTYGIDKNRIPDEKNFDKKYEEWRSSHQPFHWFAEFYEIINGNGGFNVIIGNPPYVSYSAKKNNYSLSNSYVTLPCGNLYAYVIERSDKLLCTKGKIGMIIPLSSTNANGNSTLQELLLSKYHCLISHFAVRPAKLFNGADMNLSIVIALHSLDNAIRETTPFYRWYSQMRPCLFENIYYARHSIRIKKAAFPKFGNVADVSIWNKLIKTGKTIPQSQISSSIDTQISFHSFGRYWRKCIKDVLSDNYQPLNISSSISDKLLCVLNSQLAYWYWIVGSDCYRFTKTDALSIPLPNTTNNNKYSMLASNLLVSYEKNSIIKTKVARNGIKTQEKQFFPVKSKDIIDEIDKTLARHYGFTEEELDFIINYDIKYRMGKELDAED